MFVIIITVLAVLVTYARAQARLTQREMYKDD